MSTDPPKTFTGIHHHTHFSFMDGLSRPEELVQRAKDKGLTSIAVTDHGHLHAVADVFLQGKKIGMRTIFGMEAYVIDDLEQWRADKEKYQDDKDNKRREKEEQSIDEDATNLSTESQRRALYRKGHLVLLAMNQKGLTNLYRLSHRAHKEGMYYKPRIDKRMLREHGDGIIASSSCMGGVIANRCWAMKRGDAQWEDIVREVEEFRDIFGERFFLELQFNESESQRYINDCIVRAAKQTGVHLDVATDSHYSDPEDWEAQEVLYMLRSDKTIKTRGDGWSFDVRKLYIKSAQEMWETYRQYNSDLDEMLVMGAFENTLKIDSMVEQFEPDTRTRLPTLPVDNTFKRLGEKAIARMKELGLDKKKEYGDRFLYEMKLIKEKGFANYFLIMGEIIAKAKKQMLVGPGRGSAAGSLVCYLTGITDLDPLKHNLMFERFINPDRMELPDIDTDFQDAEQAREMLREMFGQDNVACISTYGTFQIKGLLKDVCRVYDMDHKEINRLNKKIDSELRVLYKDQDKSTIVIKHEDVLRVSPTYQEFVDRFPEAASVVGKLYNRNRHVGRHACGVVIGDDLPSEMPVFMSKDVLQTSFTEGIVNKNVSSMGFVKFDLLSLSTLNVIDKALRLISERKGITYDEAYRLIDPTYLDVNDMHVLKTVFWDGNFTGIFTFTNKGIRKVAQMVRPDCFNDIAAIGALYRPGPLKSNMDRLYAENKHNPENITYMHPLMEDIMRETHGTLVYQEQMLSIGNVVGKLSMKDTNRLRKLLLKKDKSKKDDFLDAEKTELREKFVVGCGENGIASDDATRLWEMLEAFGGYGFNAAHAKAYAMVTMQTAYLRTYYPLEFFAAVLTCGKADELQSYVDDIKRQGFNVLRVDVNRSGLDHKIEGDSIRLSLLSVLGLGGKAVAKVVENQPYDSLLGFLYAGVPKGSALPLIRVGALRSIDDDVARSEAVAELWFSNPKFKLKKNRGEFEEKAAAITRKRYDQAKLVEFENELLGFNMQGSPFEILGRADKLAGLRESLTTYEQFVASDDSTAMIPVVVKEANERAQSRGGMMSFMKFGDEDGTEFEAPCFSTIWAHIGKRVKRGKVYIGTFHRRPDDPQGLVVGQQGWKHSTEMAMSYMLDVDELT